MIQQSINLLEAYKYGEFEWLRTRIEDLDRIKQAIESGAYKYHQFSENKYIDERRRICLSDPVASILYFLESIERFLYFVVFVTTFSMQDFLNMNPKN